MERPDPTNARSRPTWPVRSSNAPSPFRRRPRSPLPAPLLAALALLFVSCATHRPPGHYLSYQGVDTSPTIDDFEVCRSSGCRKTSRLSYTEAEWRSIASLFEPAPATPAEERERIVVAIAAMEDLVGAKNGTRTDRPMNKRGGRHEGQLDCIAEAANTTVGLLLLAREGLLRHHTVGFPVHRGFLQLKLPHNTATIHEKTTGDRYTVDSWFLANGEAPATVPVDAWRTSYSPFEPNPYHDPLPKPE